MQASKRIELILENARSYKHLTIQALIDLTGSSPATIRRDVNKLAEQGLITREHGGISFGKTLHRQPKTAEKKNLNVEIKQKIAREAIKYIKSEMTLFLDAGTTSFELAQQLSIFDKLTIVTTDLKIAHYLSEKEHHTIIMLGGVIDNYSQSVVSHPYDQVLDYLIPDICFCTCSAFDVKYGVTSPTLEKATLKQKLSKLGKLNILLTDSSKFNQTAVHFISALEDYDLLICDKALPKDKREELSQILEITFV